jgi:hypothetical protein
VLVGVGEGVGVVIGVVVGMIGLTMEDVVVGTCVLMIVLSVFVLPLPGPIPFPMPIKSAQTRIRKKNAIIPVTILAFVLHGLNPALLVLCCQF